MSSQKCQFPFVLLLVAVSIVTAMDKIIKFCKKSVNWLINRKQVDSGVSVECSEISNRMFHLLQRHQVTLEHIESRPDRNNSSKYEFIVDIRTGSGDVKNACNDLRQFTTDMQVLSRGRKRTSSDSEGRVYTDFKHFSIHAFLVLMLVTV